MSSFQAFIFADWLNKHGMGGDSSLGQTLSKDCLQLILFAGDRLKVARACLSAGIPGPADFERMCLDRVSELSDLTAVEMNDNYVVHRMNKCKKMEQNTSK